MRCQCGLLVSDTWCSSSSVKKEKMSQNLLQWTVADVASYFSAAGFPEQAMAFRTQVSAPLLQYTKTNKHKALCFLFCGFYRKSTNLKVQQLIYTCSKYLSPIGNRWEVPPPDAAQWRADRFVHPTRPRPQNLRAPRKSAAEDPLPGVWRSLKWWQTLLHWFKTHTCMEHPLPSGWILPLTFMYAEGVRGGVAGWEERLRWFSLSLWEWPETARQSSYLSLQVLVFKWFSFYPLWRDRTLWGRKALEDQWTSYRLTASVGPQVSRKACGLCDFLFIHPSAEEIRLPTYLSTVWFLN